MLYSVPPPALCPSTRFMQRWPATSSMPTPRARVGQRWLSECADDLKFGGSPAGSGLIGLAIGGDPP